jgi:hypothetical protein
MRLKPICLKCHREMSRVQSGISVMFTRYVAGSSPRQAPYQAYRAARYRCGECGSEVVSGFAERPFWRDFEDVDAPDCDVFVQDLLNGH